MLGFGEGIILGGLIGAASMLNWLVAQCDIVWSAQYLVYIPVDELYIAI